MWPESHSVLSLLNNEYSKHTNPLIEFGLTAPFSAPFLSLSLPPSISSPLPHCPPLPTHSSHTHSEREYVVIRLSQRQASHHCVRTA